MLKFIFWIIIIYSIYRLTTAWLMPMLLRSYLKKQQKKYKPRSNDGTKVKMENGAGEIIIPRQKNMRKEPSDHMGEYTEYEDQSTKD